MTGDVDQLLIGTSLPFLLAPGLHHVEAWDEAVSEGAWGRWFARRGETIRQGADLEHWAAFDDGFRRVADIVSDVASGRRGSPPAATLFLSGDVHHSYLAEILRGSGGRILQAVCSPIRNPMPRHVQQGTRVAARRTTGRLMRLLARSARVPTPPVEWNVDAGPWFDNCLATLVADGDTVRLAWETADSDDDGGVRLRTVYATDIGPRPAGAAR